jgi:hypothetical protein
MCLPIIIKTFALWDIPMQHHSMKTASDTTTGSQRKPLKEAMIVLAFCSSSFACLSTIVFTHKWRTAIIAEEAQKKAYFLWFSG